ncbi:MAG: hypothetical protein M3198_19680 [Actinomycetota bacterium]|nr:hypothetical protein [Actinomycetota bacterium]
MVTTLGGPTEQERPVRSAAAIEAYFDSLGRGVEGAWAGYHNNEAHFPEVATRVLAETPVPPDADAVGVLQFLTSRHRLVPQEVYGFGEPPVTLYRGRDFRISALYWLDGTTAIHQHSFSGAFRVLEGSSIHVVYGFSGEEAVTSRLLLGDLRFGAAELLRRGDVRAILAGDAFIHALFHLDRPSVTIVVRTNHQEETGPQFQYLRPGVAFDPFFEDETLDRQLRGLTTLNQFAPEEALRCAREMISAADLFAGFWVTQHWLTLDRSGRADEVVEHLVRRHGSIGDILRRVFAEKRRQYGIIIRRRLVQDAMHRLFLALILNLPDRASVDAILKCMFPAEDPASLLARWVEELNSPALRGISGLRLTNEELSAFRSALHNAGNDPSSAPLETLRSKIQSTPLLEALLR